MESITRAAFNTFPYIILIYIDFRHGFRTIYLFEYIFLFFIKDEKNELILESCVYTQMMVYSKNSPGFAAIASRFVEMLFHYSVRRYRHNNVSCQTNA